MILMQGECSHEVKVTRIPGKGYGVRVFTNGKLNQEATAPTRADIGPVARSLLRMEDKCGNISNYASRARHRIGEKELKRKSKQ